MAAMAASPLQRLDEQITCSVCLDRYTDPKLLRCHHVYCRVCLEGLLRRSPSPAVLVCPTCRKETPVPEEGGVSGLEAAFHINGLLEIRDSLCENAGDIPLCSTSNGQASRLDSRLGQGQHPDKPHPAPMPMCPSHDRNELKLFCETCNEVICFQCTVRQHDGHSYEYVKDVVGKHKALIPPLLGAVKDETMHIEKAVAAVDARVEEVNGLRTSIEGDIHSVLQEIHEKLSTRETELVHKLDQITSRKLKSLATERDCKEQLLVQASTCTQQVQETMDTNTDIEILSAKKTMVRKLQQTMALIRDEPDLLKVSTEADMMFSVPLDLAPQCRGFGQVFMPNSIDPQKCLVTGQGLETVQVDERALIFMKVYDFKGTPFQKPVTNHDMECKVVHVRTGDEENCEVHQTGGNTYEISYVPIRRGAHEVHIRVDDVHVSGSPFAVTALSTVEKLGESVTVSDSAVRPWGVAVNRREEAIVSECNGQKISVLGRDGYKIWSFGSWGSGKNQLTYPRGIALDGEGNIFVVDSGNQRVQKFTENGQLIASGGTTGTGRDQFCDPKGLAFNFVSNKVYVADVHRIQVMNSDLTFAGSFGRHGSGEGQFSNTFCIACDGGGNVYVGDKDNRNIQIFTAEGQFVKTFLTRRQGNSSKRFGRRAGGQEKVEVVPVGLAVDALGLVYVSDNSTHSVHVFSPDGVCVTTFGKEGSASGEFKVPRGLAVTEEGVVYVCDFNNDRVQLF